jgi:SP family general alpha glucoside:H+ symporter-like MFS transporter
MSRAFERLPTADEDTQYYGRQSIDVADGVSQYDPHTERRMSDNSSNASLLNRKHNTQRKTKEDDNEKSKPLGKSIKQYSRLVWWMLGMAFAFLYSGYDSVILGALNGIEPYERDLGEWIFNDDPNPDLAKWDWTIPAMWMSIWDGVGPLGQIAGTAFGGWLMDRTGRRSCIMVGSVIGIIAIMDLVMLNKPADKEWRRIMVLIGKVVQGCGIGMIKIGTMAYMSEVTPTSLKGPVMSLVPTFTLIGQLIGAIVIFLVSKDPSSKAYVIPLGSQLLVAIPPLVFAFFLPESPAYLLRKNRQENAYKSLGRLLGPKNDAKAALDKLEHTMEEESKNAVSVSYWDCFKGNDRRRTLIVMFAGCIEFLFGLSLLSSVSTFLERMNMKSSYSLLFLIGGITIGMIANFGSSWTISHFGRRQLVTTSFLITAGLWGVMGFAGIKQFPWTAWFAGGLCVGVIVVCGLGCWPASYAIQGETSSLRLRSKTMSLGALMNNITGIFANIVMPMLYNPDGLDLGAKTGFAFAGLSLFGAGITYLFVPELKGRNELEIDHFFAKGIKSIGSTTWRDTHEEIPLNDA